MTETIKTQDIIENLRARIQSYNDLQNKQKELKNAVIIAKTEAKDYKIRHEEHLKNLAHEIEVTKVMADDAKKEIDKIKTEMRNI